MRFGLERYAGKVILNTVLEPVSLHSSFDRYASKLILNIVVEPCLITLSQSVYQHLGNCEDN